MTDGRVEAGAQSVKRDSNSVHRCGICGLPIHEAEFDLRHFGTFSAHSEYRCVELLKAALNEAKAALAGLLIEHKGLWWAKANPEEAEVDRAGKVLGTK